MNSTTSETPAWVHERQEEETTEDTSCSKCEIPENNSSDKFTRVICPRPEKNDRSGHGKKTYIQRIWMAVEQSKKCPSERKRKHFQRKLIVPEFSGQFQHDEETGELSAQGRIDYLKFLNALEGETVIPMMKNIENPLRGLDSTLTGGSSCSFLLVEPFSYFSKAHLAELIELHFMNFCESLPFDQNSQQLDQVLLLLSYRKLRNGLAYTAHENEPFSKENIFRCFSNPYPEPYLSQFWFYSFQKPFRVPGKYRLACAPGHSVDQNHANKWGFSFDQAVSMTNGKTIEEENGVQTIEPEDGLKNFERYITNGYSLGLVGYQISIDDHFKDLIGKIQLLNLESRIPGLETSDAFRRLERSIPIILENTEIVSSYWQWYVYRRPTPLEAGIDFSKRFDSGELPEWLQEWTDLLDLIRERNNDYLRFYPYPEQVSSVISKNDDSYQFLEPQYTLAVSKREGYETCPSYPNQKAVAVGAGITLIQIFLNTDIPLISAFNTKLHDSESILVKPNNQGEKLESLEDDKRLVSSELNKFAMNLGMAQCWNGSAYSSDTAEGLLLGQEIAIRHVDDLLSTWYLPNQNQPIIQVTFTDFNNQERKVVPSTCYRKV